LAPFVDENQMAQDEKYIGIARTEGGELAWGGERLNRDTKGHYLSPALFTNTKNEMRINREEVFGPRGLRHSRSGAMTRRLPLPMTRRLAFPPAFSRPR
jgi:hypothetical protein